MYITNNFFLYLEKRCRYTVLACTVTKSPSDSYDGSVWPSDILWW